MKQILTFIRMKAIPLFIVFVALAGCSEESNEPFVITTESEYAVYRAMIEAMYIDDDVELIVIESKNVFNLELPLYTAARTIFYHISDKPLDLAVLPETFNSVKSRNRQSETLDCKKLALSVPCKILDQQDLQELFPSGDGDFEIFEDNWDRFYEKYPGAQGIMQLSKIGFDTEGSQAHALAGSGYYVLLARKGDTWVIRDTAELWIS